MHLDNLQAKFDYRDLDLIFKIIATIMFVVDVVSAQYLENNLPSLTKFYPIFKVMVTILIVMQMVSTPCDGRIIHRGALVDLDTNG